MIKRVYGTYDGVNDMIFRLKGDSWESLVPFKQSGEYIVSIYAEDDAGNTAYYGKVLFTANIENMIFTSRWLDVDLEAELKTLINSPDIDKYSTKFWIS